MLALACDQRVMREDRGFFCLPEVDINIPFSAGMSALVQSKLTPQIAHEVMLTGRRYGGADAARVGIVDLCVAEESVLPEAIGAAEALSKKSRDTVAAIKRTMYSDALELLSEQVDLSGLG
jgi:enoyl-CoA hydratase/carnithine racemase